MKNIREAIISSLEDVLKDLGITGVESRLELPKDLSHGDYTSNIALAIFSKSKVRTAMELAEKIADDLRFEIRDLRIIEKIDVVKPGFINFWLSKDFLISQLGALGGEKKIDGIEESHVALQKIMIEYADPNTHKEMHIGHLRTLLTGEAIARILESRGNKVFRANYQGDIGSHVAKALYGIKKLMLEDGLTLEKINKWKNLEKAHFLGRGYIRGNQDYETHKEEIDKINKELYEIVLSNSRNLSSLSRLYLRSRKWSLDYYDDFYKEFYVKFDRLFFESEVAFCGRKIVEENVDKIFKNSEGAIIFSGEKYGLHTRVFVTKQGYSTYEGKEMCLAFKQYEAFPFDKNIHVVASEQAGYFKVVFKALELLDSEKFKGKEFHLSMGMVNIVGMKISSRTGQILRVDELIEGVREGIKSLIKEGRIETKDREKILEQIAVGAIKYSMLRVGVLKNVEFDIQKSISLDGDSGPYLQYAYARTQSVLSKVKTQNSKLKTTAQSLKLKDEEWVKNYELNDQELDLLRVMYRFDEVIKEAADKFSPNILCGYLFDLAQRFNLFYQKYRILEAGSVGINEEHPRDVIENAVEIREFRLALTSGVGKIIREGLYLLGISAPEEM